MRSPVGSAQWYRAEKHRPVVEAPATAAGTDLGALRRFDAPVGFGFSGPPRRPSMVKLRSLLVDPLGRLDNLAPHSPEQHGVGNSTV